ncbi:TPA: DUF551 domain-containing protein [Klebsiella pneumoniae]|uniref:DUF551 domain-containing protein n=1 Tax=Klebsiella pneumoniae TaxID=573 RepID=UPI0007CD2CCD|nr:DUF551 domain-containing protein [Klebsiella pneumoniae]ROE83493.1 DUF551 domain-containing protein [Klebsiella pneumoniae subsp. pneumoniae]SAW12389.1 Eaa1 [Klebsiella pneumoniae]VAO09947.1 Eaa1 [Klebsiella pneumoniae]HBW0305831.1 DUF551 domain-containing protein [Klebsiella pneumoniae]HBW0835839.1 DUF551 domain-containing protein [Klebsiella pneumoniae]
MSEFSRETLLNIIETDHVQCGEASALARMALAATDSSESVELPLDYLQGHKDGLEWAARLAEANHPDTGDWLYDDPIELAKAIRKGPDMPPAQPVADSEPVIVVGDDGGDALSYRRLIQSFEPGTKLYLHAQPAPVVPDDVLAALQKVARIRLDMNDFDGDLRGIADCLCDAEEALIEVVSRRAAMLAAAPHDTPALNSVQSVVTVPGKWIPVIERMPEDEQEVLTINKMGHRFVSFFDKHSGLFFDGLDAPAACCIEHVLVTHWMPLPAAPQEVKGE